MQQSITVSAEKAQKCQMCGSKNLSVSVVTYKSGKKEDVPVCQDCGHFNFQGTEYAIVVRSVGRWASAADLRGVIEAILQEYMPPEDVKSMVVEVAEFAT